MFYILNTKFLSSSIINLQAKNRATESFSYTCLAVYSW